MKQIVARDLIRAEQFQSEVVPAAVPVVLKGVARQWPMLSVDEALQDSRLF